MPPKVVVSIPKSLQTTAKERKILKSAFKTKIRSVVKPRGDTQDITNVGGVVTDIVVASGRVGKTGSKRRRGKTT
jgi:hypothetical protein